jgi:hypothetical protein
MPVGAHLVGSGRHQRYCADVFAHTATSRLFAPPRTRQDAATALVAENMDDAPGRSRYKRAHD